MAHIDIHHASEYGILEECRAFVDDGGDLNKRGLHAQTPLHVAVQYGQAATAKYLIDSGCMIDARDEYDNTPLHRACIFGKAREVELLLREGADPAAKNDVGHAPGKDGLFDRDVAPDVRVMIAKLVTEARERKARCYAQSETLEGCDPFEFARQGDTETLAKFLAIGGLVDIRDEDRCTPLHHAAAQGQVKVCALLVQAGADLEASNRFSQRPLYLAAMWGQAEVVKFLTEHNAELEAKDPNGLTPLHRAAQEGWYEVVDILLKDGADIHSITRHRASPLHLAAKYGKRGVVELLCERGADPWRKDDDGELAGVTIFPSVPASQRRAVQLVLERVRTNGSAPGAPKLNGAASGSLLHTNHDRNSSGVAGRNNLEKGDDDFAEEVRNTADSSRSRKSGGCCTLQ